MSLYDTSDDFNLILSSKVICNLQKTPYDGIADIVLHTKTDDLLRLIMKRLGLSIPDITFDFKFRMIVDQGAKKIFIDNAAICVYFKNSKISAKKNNFYLKKKP